MSFKNFVLESIIAIVLTLGGMGVVCAAPPPTSSTYTATPGTIDPSCPADAISCGTTSNGDRYFVRAVTDNNGTTYYQTIILPSSTTPSTNLPTGGFIDCSYVQSPLDYVLINSSTSITPAFFDASTLAGKDLAAVVPNATGGSCSAVQFKFPLITDPPSLVADANEYANLQFKVTDGASGAEVIGQSTIMATPSVSFGLDQTVAEGGTVIVKVYLSGYPSGDPIVVPYTISGSATPGVDHGAADGTLTISPADPASSEISFPVYQDNVDDDGETVTITLGQPSNAQLGDKVSTTVTISEKDRFVTASLNARMNPDYDGSGFSHLSFSQNCCTAVVPLMITAEASANFVAGQLYYDWSGTDAALLASANTQGDTLSFNPDPQSLRSGIYTARVKVSSENSPEVTAEAELPIKVVTDFDQSQQSPDNDSDSDGTIDGIETFIFDQNENGIVDYLDAFRAPNILQLHPQPVNAGITTLDKTMDDGTNVSLQWEGFINTAISDAKQALISDSGTRLRLGRTALALESNGASVPIDQFKQAAAAAFPDQTNLLAMDKLYGDSIEDIEVTHLNSPGQSIHVVMPRANPPSTDSVIWAFNPARGWGRFRLDTRNALDSTAGFMVKDKLFSCPDVHNAAYINGTGSECVRLTVEDGGPNDADGKKNGVVKLLIGEGPDIADPVSAADTATSSGSATGANNSGGNGALSIYALIMLALAAYASQPKREIKGVGDRGSKGVYIWGQSKNPA